VLQCQSGHARTTPATLGLGDGPRGRAAGSDDAYISARARASRDRAAAARSLGRATGRTRQARAKHATRNMAGQRDEMPSEFGDEPFTYFIERYIKTFYVYRDRINIYETYEHYNFVR
jgi:hypothetical protein